MSKTRMTQPLTLNLPEIPAAIQGQLRQYLEQQKKALEDFGRQLNQQLTPGYTPPPK